MIISMRFIVFMKGYFDYETISDLNINLIKEISFYLKLDVNFLTASKFNINKKDEKLVDILKKFHLTII